MKATFGTKQPLKSLEFGTLLYGILPKGVYKSPTITYSNGTLSVSGGIFLFYDTDTDKNYAVRVQDVNLSMTTLTANDWLFISYTYNTAVAAEPQLEISNSSATSDSKIRLGRLVQTAASASSLTFDSSSMEMCGQSYSVDDGLIEHAAYSPSEYTAPLLDMMFKNKVITNSGTVSVNAISTTSLEGLDASKAQYLYIDSEGALKCADAIIPRFGKLVIAEKAANGAFTLNRFPYRAEVTGWNIEVPGLFDPSIVSKENDIYNDGADETATELGLDQPSHLIAVNGIIKALVDHVGKLERKVDDLTTRLKYLEDLKDWMSTVITNMPSAADIAAQSTTPLPDKLVITKVDSETNVNINGSVTVNPNTSSFGTSDAPIHNLYVTTSLYTDQLFVTE